MKRLAFAITACLAVSLPASAQFITPPAGMVVAGIEAIEAGLAKKVEAYTLFHPSLVQGWHPQQPAILIHARHGNFRQLQLVAAPGARPAPLGDLADAAGGVWVQPKTGSAILFARHDGGVRRLFLLDINSKRVTPVSPDNEFAGSATWNRTGSRLFFSTTSGRADGSTDAITTKFYANDANDWRVTSVFKPMAIFADRHLTDFRLAPDEKSLMYREEMAEGKAHLWQWRLADGKHRRITVIPRDRKTSTYAAARFSEDGKKILAISKRDGTLRRLLQINVVDGMESVLTGHLNVDVEEFAVSHVARRIAFLTRENGASVLRFLDLDSNKELPRPALLPGDISNLHWQHENHDRTRMAPSDDTLAFNLSSAKSPSDVFTYQIKATKLTRWTNGAAPGLSPLDFVEPQRIEWKTAESKTTPGFFYQPDAATFPGKRPVIIEVLSGTPVFLGRNNYFVNALGVAFVRLDNNTHVDAVLKWIATEPELDAGRVMVMEGDDMVLASSLLTTRPALKVRADALRPDKKSQEDFLFYAQVAFVEAVLLR